MKLFSKVFCVVAAVAVLVSASGRVPAAWAETPVAPPAPAAPAPGALPGPVQIAPTDVPMNQAPANPNWQNLDANHGDVKAKPTKKKSAKKRHGGKKRHHAAKKHHKKKRHH